MLKGPRQTLNTEPAQTWLGPVWLPSCAWRPCLSDCCLPHLHPLTGLSALLKHQEDSAQSETNKYRSSGCVNADFSFICSNKSWVKQNRDYNFLFKMKRTFSALTSPPTVQVAAHPWHPDLEQRSLCEFFLLCGHVNGDSHEACVEGRRVDDGGAQSCDLCACVCFTEHYLLQVSWLLLRRSTW